MVHIMDWFGWAFCEVAFCMFREIEELELCIVEMIENNPINFSSPRIGVASILYRSGCWFYSWDMR